MADDNTNVQQLDPSTMSPEEILAELKRLTAAGDVENELYGRLLASVSERKEELSAEQAQEFVNLNEVVQDSDYFKGKAKSKKAQETLREFADIGLAISDLVTSNQQVREGEASQRSSIEPTPPSRYTLDPAISRSISESFEGISPSRIEAQLQPLKQDISDAYTADLNNATVASGGQAGSFAALGQAAVNRRIRGALQLGGVRQQIRDANLRNLNYSLQNRLAERRLQQTGDFQTYAHQLNQFNAEQQAAGALEQAGRQNRRTSIQNLAGSLLPIADNVISGTGGFIENLSQQLSNNNNASGIKDPALNDIKNNIIDFDNADESDLTNYGEALDRDLFLNQYRGLV